jgi:hypothetical protein
MKELQQLQQLQRSGNSSIWIQTIIRYKSFFFPQEVMLISTASSLSSGCLFVEELKSFKYVLMVKGSCPDCDILCFMGAFFSGDRWDC